MTPGRRSLLGSNGLGKTSGQSKLISPPTRRSSAMPAFHSQQAVEKALKAFLTRNDHPFRPTHDIGELALACLEHEPSLEALLRESAPLTEYAWRFRYPGEVFEPERREVEDAQRLAQQVVEEVTAIAGANR